MTNKKQTNNCQSQKHSDNHVSTLVRIPCFGPPWWHSDMCEHISAQTVCRFFQVQARPNSPLSYINYNTIPTSMKIGRIRAYAGVPATPTPASRPPETIHIYIYIYICIYTHIIHIDIYIYIIPRQASFLLRCESPASKRGQDKRFFL